MAGKDTETARAALSSDLLDQLGVPATQATLMTAAELAALFQVSTRTVNTWAKEGRIPCTRTPGGQRRFPAAAVVQLLPDGTESIR
jgi:excisionase family DNA binding protein